MKHQWETQDDGTLICTECDVRLPPNRREDGPCEPFLSYATCNFTYARVKKWNKIILEIHNPVAKKYLRFLLEDTPEATNERRLIDFELTLNLVTTFTWELTPQGHHFWKDIHENLR